MKRNTKILTIASAVLALSTALSAGADPSTTDAQAQAGALLTAGSTFHTTQAHLPSRIENDAQNQAGAIIIGSLVPNAARTVNKDAARPLTQPGRQLAHRTVQRNADAQSMAATVLLGRGA